MSFLKQAVAQPSSSVTNDEKDPRSGTSLPQVDKDFLDSASAHGPILDSVRVHEPPSSAVVDVDDKTLDRTSTVNMVNSLAETRSTGVETRRFQALK